MKELRLKWVVVVEHSISFPFFKNVLKDTPEFLESQMTKSFVFASYPLLPRAASEASGVKVWWSQNFEALFIFTDIESAGWSVLYQETWNICITFSNFSNLQVLPPCKLLYLATFPQSRSQFQSWILVTHTTFFFFENYLIQTRKDQRENPSLFHPWIFLGEQKVVYSVGPQTWGAKRRLEADRGEHGSLGFWNEISFQHRMCHFSFFTSTVLSDWFWSWKAFSIKQSPPPGIGHDAWHGPWFARHRNG